MSSYDHCRIALEAHEKALGQYANVVGLGIQQEDGGPADRCRVAVYVSRKLTSEQLAEEDRIPRTIAIDVDEGRVLVETKVIELGSVQLE